MCETRCVFECVLARGTRVIASNVTKWQGSSALSLSCRMKHCRVTRCRYFFSQHVVRHLANATGASSFLPYPWSAGGSKKRNVTEQSERIKWRGKNVLRRLLTLFCLCCRGNPFFIVTPEARGEETKGNTLSSRSSVKQRNIFCFWNQVCKGVTRNNVERSVALYLFVIVPADSLKLFSKGERVDLVLSIVEI